MQLTAKQQQAALIGGVAAVVLFAGPAIARWLSEKIGAAAVNIPVAIVEGAAQGVYGALFDDDKCAAAEAADDAWSAFYYCNPSAFFRWYWARPSFTQRAVDAWIKQESGGAQLTPTEIFQLWMQNTGGVLLPGQTQEQAMQDWFYQYVAAPF